MNCMYSMVRRVPMRWVAKRARKSEPPQERAVSKPSKIPMMGYEDLPASADLPFFGSRPRTAMTFWRSFQTSLFAPGFRSK